MSIEVDPKNCWESHCNKGLFSIEFPYGIRPNQEEDGTTLAFSLPTNPQSEVIAGVFPTPGSEGVTPLVIRGEIERFMAQCVGGRQSEF
jgi:hypothetical protein